MVTKGSVAEHDEDERRRKAMEAVGQAAFMQNYIDSLSYDGKIPVKKGSDKKEIDKLLKKQPVKADYFKLPYVRKNISSMTYTADIVNGNKSEYDVSELRQISNYDFANITDDGNFIERDYDDSFQAYEIAEYVIKKKEEKDLAILFNFIFPFEEDKKKKKKKK